MDIISETIIDASMEKVEKIVEEGTRRLIEYGSKIVEEVYKEYMPLLDDLVKNLSGEIKGIAFGKEVDMLDMPTLVLYAQKYIVPNSNETVAMKVKQADNYFVYLAYSKDRQLLPVADNKYVIIKAQTLSKEVEDLFENSELVILK